MLIAQFEFPISWARLARLSSAIRGADVFTPSFPSDQFDPYSVMTYLQADLVSKTKAVLMVDRNVLTRWIALVRGTSVPDQQHRTVAAILAFAQCADIYIEPHIALHELASHAGNPAANEELRVFRVADHISPALWGAVALGEKQRLTFRAEDLPHFPAREEFDFAKPLHKWTSNYVLALKLAELELQGGSAESRMHLLIDWMYHEFVFGGPALVLASRYLAPNSSRRKLLKRLRAENREEALAGIRNAAWDLTLISEWVEESEAQTSNNKVTVLCSLEAAVHDLARGLSAHYAAFDSTLQGLEISFERYWPRDSAKRLASRTAMYFSNLEDAARTVNWQEDLEAVEVLISRGEERIRSWRAS